MSDARTALVIDDDADIREVLRTMLESRGFQVDTLSDGIDAVKLEKRYDVILLDLQMPVFDGQRLSDYWQLTNPAILRRVIVLTGYDQLATNHKLQTFARLAKPFDYMTVIRVVDDCLAQPNLSSLGGNDV
jgi:CheY-like chemotaxis protein